MTSIQKPIPKLFTPLREIGRYGWHWPDAMWWLLWAVLACVLTLSVPFGLGKDVHHFLRVHVTLFGFGATVFGFTILGGKDDFFEPLLQDDGGLNTLRNMVLFLFVPLALHGLACVLLAVRILFPCISDHLYSAYIWRFIYSFIAVWASAQTWFSYRFLFVLAITRLVWKDGKAKKRERTRARTRARMEAAQEGGDPNAARCDGTTESVEPRLT